MKTLLVAPAALLAAGLFLIPDDASARPGWRGGGFHGGFRGAAFHGGFRGAAFHGGVRHGWHGGFRPGFGYHRAGFYRPHWGYYRRSYGGFGAGAALATGAIIGAGLAAAASAPYYDNGYGYADVGYGGACYQVPTWAWTGWGYQQVLVTRCD